MFYYCLIREINGKMDKYHTQRYEMPLSRVKY
jgi:hypothetical protein